MTWNQLTGGFDKCSFSKLLFSDLDIGDSFKMSTPGGGGGRGGGGGGRRRRRRGGARDPKVSITSVFTQCSV